MVVEIGQLDDPCQVASRPGRLGDPPDIALVRLLGSVREQLQGGQFDARQAMPYELASRGETKLEQVMQPCYDAGLRGDRGRDTLHMLDDGFTEAGVLAHMAAASQPVRDCRVHSLQLRACAWDAR